jgi:hypothetical protein
MSVELGSVNPLRALSEHIDNRAQSTPKWRQIPMDILYTARVTATGGRHGSIRSDDGLLDHNLAIPKGRWAERGALQIQSNSLQGLCCRAARF